MKTSTYSVVNFYGGEHILFTFDVQDDHVSNYRAEWQNIDGDWVEIPETRRKSKRLSDWHLYHICQNFYKQISEKDFDYLDMIFIIGDDGVELDYESPKYRPRKLTDLSEQEIKFISKRKKIAKS